MRVLWFSNTPAAGDEYISSNGTGGWLKSLDKALQDCVELHVAFYDRSYPREFKVGKTTYHQLAPYDKLSLIKRRVHLLFGKKNPDLNRYLDVIKYVNPDIIHIHGTERPWVQLVNYTDVPVLLSIQAVLTVMNFKYYSGISRRFLPINSGYISSYKGFLKNGIIERENVVNVEYVMGRTDWDRRVYSVLASHSKYFVAGEVLRDGFYTSRWNSHEREDNRVILHTTTGTLLFKGFETICQALSILNNVGYDVEWRVAGVSENSELTRIVKRVMGRSYPQKGLLLLGPLEEKELIKKMLEADLFVSPSHQDNSPNALCEATLLGMPCISTYAGGSGSIICDGRSGILIQDGDPWAMAGAVIELVNNKDKAVLYGNNARDEAIIRHEKGRVINQVLEAYNTVLKDRQRE